jgi:hypothetical protein
MIDSMSWDSNPIGGTVRYFLQSQPWDSGIGRLIRMKNGPAPREILKANLRALMKESDRFAHLSTVKKIVAASGGKLTNGTVGRMTSGSHTTDIDKLGELAAVFGMSPWQLLVEDLNPKALPVLASAEFLTQIKAVVDSAAADQSADAKRRFEAGLVKKQRSVTRKKSA